jgi:hypothetical protein
MKLQVKDLLELLETEVGKVGSSRGRIGENMVLPTVDFGLLASRTEKETFLLF